MVERFRGLLFKEWHTKLSELEPASSEIESVCSCSVSSGVNEDSLVELSAGHDPNPSFGDDPIFIEIEHSGDAFSVNGVHKTPPTRRSGKNVSTPRVQRALPN